MPALPEQREAFGGPHGLPSVDWSLGKALIVGVVTNLVIAQFLAGGILFAILGVTSTENLDSGGALVYVSAVADVVWLAGLLVWLSSWHRGWVRRIGIVRKARDVGFGVLTGVLLYPAIAIVVAIPLSILFRALSGHEATTPDQLPQNLSMTASAVSVVLAVGIAPIVEELYFRGILFRSVRDRHGFWPGAIVSGLVFGAAHFVPAAWQDTVLLQSIMVFTGIALAWIYERRANLVADIAAHMTFNAIGVVLIFASR